MFGLGGDDEEKQRFWNLVVFHIPMTDKEWEESSPGFFIFLGIIVVIIVGILIFA